MIVQQKVHVSKVHKIYPYLTNANTIMYYFKMLMRILVERMLHIQTISSLKIMTIASLLWILNTQVRGMDVKRHMFFQPPANKLQVHEFWAKKNCILTRKYTEINLSTFLNEILATL